ncbi:hypothetical protein [Streptomyces sp. KR80]|uniref:hypothetical protein n=1 Tax=Streptomyces sp. KR80 TaxID=3457426 RepID=UPI003FD1DDF3
MPDNHRPAQQDSDETRRTEPPAPGESCTEVQDEAESKQGPVAGDVPSEETPDESLGEAPEPDVPPRTRSHVLLVRVGAPLAALAAAGAAWVAFSGPEDSDKPKVPTYAVVYTVSGSGTADITYATGGGLDGKGGEVTAVELPWTKKVPLPQDGTQPHVSVVLGAKGGTAQCTLTIKGRHVQRSTAMGKFGRATCSAESLPSATPGAAQSGDVLAP